MDYCGILNALFSQAFKMQKLTILNTIKNKIWTRTVFNSQILFPIDFVIRTIDLSLR